MKIANIVGARPQFIKFFPISEAIKKYAANSDNVVSEILIHTGQHYDYNMSKVFFDEFSIKTPDYHLGVGSGSHGEQTGQIIQKVEDVLMKVRPDVVMVYGDTNSTLSGALAATKIHIPVAHVESGLRSFNKKMPEEINRILTDRVSTLLFCPSKAAIKNLRNESFNNVLNNGDFISRDYFFYNADSADAEIDNPLVINTGDVMYDAFLFSVNIANRRSRIIEQLQLEDKDYNLLTLHRAENTDNLEKLKEIIDFVNEISMDRNLIFPMHPRTKKVYGSSRIKFADNIKIIMPLGYFDNLMILQKSALVMTDSGGIQKEAYWLKVPCITLRNETEWVETLQSGWNVLYKNYSGSHKPLVNDVSYYGDGEAAVRIVSALIKTIKQ